MSATGIMDLSGSAVDDAYAFGFGTMKNNTVYVKSNLVQAYEGEPEYETDVRGNVLNQIHAQIEQKALNTTSAGAGTAGQAMIPVYVDPQIVDQTRKQTPIVELIPRVTNMGITADYNNITAKGGGYTLAENAAVTFKDTTLDRFSTSIKYLYSAGEVTGQIQAGAPSYSLQGFQPSSGATTGPFMDQGAPTAMQLHVLTKAREMRELEEQLIINGNATTSSQSGNPNGTEFDGIVTLMSTTNTVDKNSAALTFADINKAIENAFVDGGLPNLAICPPAVFTKLLDLLSSKIAFLQASQRVSWGFTAIVLNTAVGPVPVVQSRFLNNTSGQRSMFFLDMSVVEMRVLQDMTYEPLAKVKDSTRFMMKIYECLIIRNTNFCSSITEISD